MSTPSDLLAEGIAQFNSGEFYACHDTLEALWMEAQDPERRFYQGLLQTAVAYYHLGNGNWRGSVILLGEGISKLSDYFPSYGGWDIAMFLAANQSNLSALQALGAEQVLAFDLSRIPSLLPVSELPVFGPATSEQLNS
ncbi:MAG: DUF309 domain-containing protein [Synechococcaceae cyanobacterium RM1_1_27]|nr:DUF309 domain-containing protein [Synechococcaceae cyanobacterium SM2_3_2]NJO86206.1 DUF309 domain-containing protein [Synechococcaceae cyanobacterium RM1_1_27]